MLQKLLIKNQDERLGSKNGFNDIKSHPFFKGLDFTALENRKIEAPYKPPLKDSTDVTNFDAEFTSEESSYKWNPWTKFGIYQEKSRSIWGI